MSGITINLQTEAHKTRKITKIMPYKDGGFTVLVPYHAERKGFLVKHPAKYGSGTHTILHSECIEYSVKDRVKLSFHKDGFIQFSGENSGTILSGRDPNTGEPKGLGPFISPLFESQIKSGPTFAISCWGLEDFPEIKTPEKSQLNFLEEDYYYLYSNPNNWNTYMIEGWIFPEQYWAGIKKKDNDFVLSLIIPNFLAHLAVLDFKIIPLPNQPIMIGLRVSRTTHNFPGRANSGFMLQSPSDLKNALMAFYPSFVNIASINNLDYSGK
jgi:hypothetical protein